MYAACGVSLRLCASSVGVQEYATHFHEIMCIINEIVQPTLTELQEMKHTSLSVFILT